MDEFVFAPSCNILLLFLRTHSLALSILLCALGGWLYGLILYLSVVFLSNGGTEEIREQEEVRFGVFIITGSLPAVPQIGNNYIHIFTTTIYVWRPFLTSTNILSTFYVLPTSLWIIPLLKFLQLPLISVFSFSQRDPVWYCPKPGLHRNYLIVSTSQN